MLCPGNVTGLPLHASTHESHLGPPVNPTLRAISHVTVFDPLFYCQAPANAPTGRNKGQKVPISLQAWNVLFQR